MRMFSSLLDNDQKIKWFSMSIALMGVAVFLMLPFATYPYPYVHTDPDSFYIFNSLSLLTGHTINYNDHPGLLLQIVGTFPIVLGAVLIMLDAVLTQRVTLIQRLIAQKEAGLDSVDIVNDILIRKVIANLPFFQQLFLGLVVLIFVGVLVVVLSTLYQKDKQRQSVAMVLSGLALMMPPTLCSAVGVNADFVAFPIGILFATSLLWKRDWKNDLLTSLFFTLMVYTKIIFFPLGLLMLTIEKKAIRRVVIGTFGWLVLIYYLFWDISRLVDFLGFIVFSAMLNSSDSMNLTGVVGCYLKLFVESPVQTFCILLFVSFGFLLALKREFRITGILGLIAIIVVVGVSVFRPYKTVVYVWPTYSVGVLLTGNLFEAYPRLTRLVGVVFAVLIIACTVVLYKDSVTLRDVRMARLEYQQKYARIVTESSTECLLESGSSFPSLGDSYWLANNYTKREYTRYLEEYFKDRFGLNCGFYKLLDPKWWYRGIFHSQKDGEVVVQRYFSGQSVEGLQWVPPGGCSLAIQAGKEPTFRQEFPQLDFIPVDTINVRNMPIVNIWNVRCKQH